MNLRFASWCAVSTIKQARPEKFSIPDQLERTETEARRKGWIQAAGSFVVNGHSRTKYIQLDQAVFAAYGWSSNLSDEEILEKLLTLNLDRAKAG